jgi:hypothetical protein
VYPVEIESLNSPAGSIGYAHPVAKSLLNSSGNLFMSEPSVGSYSMGGAIEAQFHRGTNPAPVTRSALLRFLSLGDISGSPIAGPPGGITNPGGTAPPTAPGDKCTSSSQNRTVNFETFAVIKVRDPVNRVLQWTSPHKSWSAQQAIVTQVCTGPSYGGLQGQTTTRYILNQDTVVDYQPGAYYFHEYGTYAFSLEVHAIEPTGIDHTLGSNCVIVTVTPTDT